MKKALLCLIGLVASGCGQTDVQINSPPQPCPATPQSLVKRNGGVAEDITLNNVPKTVGVELSTSSSVGYRFDAKKGQKFKYTTDSGSICVWLYTPDNNLVDVRYPLEQSGKYTFQISSPQGSRTLDFHLSLKDPQGQSNPPQNPSRESSPSINPSSSSTASSSSKSTPSPVTSPAPSISSSPLVIPTPSNLESVRTSATDSNSNNPQRPSQESRSEPSDSAKPSVVAEPSSSIDWNNGVWLALAVNVLASMLITFTGNFGVKKSLKSYMQDLVDRKVGSLKVFWEGRTSERNSPKDSQPKYHIIYGGVEQDEEDVVSEEFRSAIDMINNFFKDYMKCSHEIHTLNSMKKLNMDFFDENVVLLVSGKHTIAGFDDFCRNLNLPYIYENEKLVRRNKRFEGPIESRDAYIKEKGSRIVSLASATVTRIINPNKNKLIIILNGLHGNGISGSARFLTNLAEGSLYLDFNRLNQEINSYQLVLEVANDKGLKPLNLTSMELQLCTWLSFGVDQDDIQTSIKEFCGNLEEREKAKELEPELDPELVQNP
jgi:hypothetical protein